MNPNKNFLFLMFILEALEGLRRTNVRSYGVYDGPVLGYLVGNSVLAEAGKRVKEAVFTRFFFHIMQPENIFCNALNSCIEIICNVKIVRIYSLIQFLLNTLFEGAFEPNF